MDVYEAIQKRRCVRNFLDRKIEKDKLIKILDSARWAPSAGNVQNWKLIVVREKENKRKIAEACLTQYWIARADTIIVICHDLEKMRIRFGERAFLYSIQGISAATQNILLTAYSLGIASCWVSLFDKETLSRILKLPKNLEPVVVIPLGYAAEVPPPPKRFELKEIVYFEEYGKKEL